VLQIFFYADFVKRKGSSSFQRSFAPVQVINNFGNKKKKTGVSGTGQ
jgi:hypothetical protein